MRLDDTEKQKRRDVRDNWRRETNKKTGQPLCNRCHGTGNEFVGVTGKGFWPCATCRGTGLEAPHHGG